jgi:phage terminase large subunit-like protein
MTPLMPRKASRDPFTVLHFVDWAKELRLDNEERWEVEDYFARYVEDVFKAKQLDALIRLWLIVAEGNAKTTNLAGLSLYHCEHLKRAFVPWAASSRDQAEIGYQQADVFADSMPKERRPRCYDGYRRIKFANGSRIQIFAAGAEHADGVVPTMPIIDELHRHPDLKLYRTWAGKLRKRHAQMLVISTAGEPGSDFEETREGIRKTATETFEEGSYGRYVNERVIMHEYAVRDDDILNLQKVKGANPASWIDYDYLREKHADPDMSEAHWRRFTCNIATRDEGKEPYIDLADWDECGGADPLEEGKVVSLGADGSRTWDTTVVAWAHKDEEQVITVDCCIFSVRKDIESHVFHERGKIDFEDVESYVLDRFDRFQVESAAFDPNYLENSMDVVAVRLPEASVVAVEPQAKAMREALQTMYSIMAEGRLRHRDDSAIREQIKNTGVMRDDVSKAIRKVRKIDQRMPIDVVPAMALAVWRAEHSQIAEDAFDIAFV